MNLTGDDCFFYLNSYCVKGRSCPFRHEPLARETETVCLYWEQGRCSRVHCMYRHSRADGNQIQSESLSRDTEIVGDEDSTVVVEEYSPQEEGEQTKTDSAPPELVKQGTHKIIVNQKKLADLGFPIEAFFPGFVTTNVSPKKDRPGVKSRLGYVSTSSRLHSRLGNKSSDRDSDSEEERLRSMAIRSIDLRSRITLKSRVENDYSEDPMDGDDHSSSSRKVILPKAKTFVEEDLPKAYESDGAPSLAMRIAMKRDNLYSDLKDDPDDKSYIRREDDRRIERSRSPESFRRRRSDRDRYRRRRSSERRRNRTRSRSRDRLHKQRIQVPSVMSKITIVHPDGNPSKDSISSSTNQEKEDVPGEVENKEQEVLPID